MNKDSFRSLTGIALCVAFFLAYQQYMGSKYPHLKKPQEAHQSEALAPVPSAQAPSPSVGPSELSTLVPQVPNLSLNELRLENERAIFQFTQDPTGLSSVKLKGYAKELGSAEPMELLDGPVLFKALPYQNDRSQTQLLGVERTGESLIFKKKTGTLVLTEIYSLRPDTYELELEIKVKNEGQAALELEPTLSFSDRVHPKPKQSGFLASVPERVRALTGISGELDEVEAEPACTDPSKALIIQRQAEAVDYSGVDFHYFLAVLRPEFNRVNLRAEAKSLSAHECELSFSLGQNAGLVNVGEEANLKYKAYFGPKEITELERIGSNLSHAIEFGWVRIIAYPLLQAIRWVESLVGNWGVAIILVTSLIKLLFYPLAKSAAVSMKAMQKLQPEMQRIREQYAKDPQKQQQELMRFMATHKVNPAKGCLPILPQLPVFFALYRVLSHAIELRHAPLFLWIHDLSAHDPYFVLPIIQGALQFVQQKITPTPGMDKTQARVMMMMPVIFTVISLVLPSGMVIYMITNAILTLAQQQWLNRKLN